MWNQIVRNLLLFRIYLDVYLCLHDREFNSVTFISNFVVEPTLVEQNDVLSSTGVQLEVLNEIKRMQDSIMLQQQTINVITGPQGQGRVAPGPRYQKYIERISIQITNILPF